MQKPTLSIGLQYGLFLDDYGRKFCTLIDAHLAKYFSVVITIYNNF